MNPIEILLVEDNPGDAELTAMALKQGRVVNNLRVVEDGVEALKYLRKQGAFADTNPPDLILLDLNLPKKDGREVLQEIKGDPELRRIPVVVLTTSQSDKDILKSYELHANSYITKPVDLAGFLEVVQALKQYWLAIVKLPPH